ncbi:MAG: hypothetical protein H3C34_05800 [Caldilineaceae bacterium]|nr:hypothetical protein [Caldilineaceae bacterium]
MKPIIQWEYPQPRAGLAGALDRLLGPGMTLAEIVVLGLFVGLATVALPVYVFSKGLGWTPLQLFIGTYLAFDLSGGIVANASSTTKRWYHRAGQGYRDHLGFVAVHLVYILAVTWILRAGDWLYFAVLSVYLLVAATIVLKMPLYLQRPVALGLFVIVLLLDFYAWIPTPGLEWFVPFLFLKLLVSHILREEPYRP